MSNIVMCQNRTCPSYHKCYRAQAKPAPDRQVYIIGVAPPKGRKKCEYFLPIWNKKSGQPPAIPPDSE